MNLETILAMSYRELQRACKENGLPATGKLTDLQERLAARLGEDESVQTSIPPPPAAPATPPPKHDPTAKPATPEHLVDSGARTKAIAKSAIALANMSPLPPFLSASSPPPIHKPSPAKFSQPERAVSPPTETSKSNTGRAVEQPHTFPCAHNGKHRSRRQPSALPLVAWFLLFSTMFSLTAVTFSRVDRPQVWADLKHGSVSVLASEVQRVLTQERDLAARNLNQFVQSAQHQGQATLKLMTHTTRGLSLRATAAASDAAHAAKGFALQASDAVKGGVLDVREHGEAAFEFVRGHAASAMQSLTPKAAPPCQAESRGLSIPLNLLQGAFDLQEGTPEHETASFLANSATLPEAIKPFSVLVTAKAAPGVGMEALAEEVARSLKCDTELQGRCLHVDASRFEGMGPDTAGALQRVLAAHLQREPDAVIILSSIADMHSTALHVLIDALGEDGVLQHENCRVHTAHAVVMLLQRAVQGATARDTFEGSLRAMVAAGDSPEGTVESTLRRVVPGDLPFTSETYVPPADVKEPSRGADEFEDVAVEAAPCEGDSTTVDIAEAADAHVVETDDGAAAAAMEA